MWFADFLLVTLAKKWCRLTRPFIQKKTAMDSSAHWIWNSYRFLHSTRPAELLLISQFLCGSVSQYALRMFSQCSLLMGWFTSSSTFLFRRRTHKSPRNTHAAVQRAEDVFSKKTGSWSNWFNRVLMMFVCPRNLFHILNPNSASAALNVSVMDISEVGGILSHKHLVSLKTVFLAQGYDWYDVSKAIFRFDDTAIPFQHTPWDIMRSKPLSFVVRRKASPSVCMHCCKS